MAEEKVKSKKEILDYIRNYTKSEDAKTIIKCSEIINSEGFDVWSFKKLIFLEYYIKPFLYIFENNNFKCVFIDFFSSCGANRVDTENIDSIGSAIISILSGVIPNKSKNKNNRFYKWFFIDQNKDFCKALISRVEKTLEIVNTKFKEEIKLDNDVKILCGDSNKKLVEIVSYLKKESEKEKIAVLAFIDPYTFTNIEWESWKQLCTLKFVDIIFTFPIQTIERGYKNCKDLEIYLSPSVLSLFKEYKEISKIPDNEFESAYAKDISNLVSRSINHYDLGIGVKSLENREIYRINLFTHCEAASKAVLPKAKELDKLNSNDLKEMLKQIKGEQTSLKDFNV